MDRARATRLISHAVETTRARWSEYDKTWRDLDRIFMHHGYEQQGFESQKLLILLEKRDCYSIEAMGSVLQEEDDSKYDPEYSRGLTSPFFDALRRGDRGKSGRALYDGIEEFQRPGGGRPGGAFWLLIWRLLVCCRYLRAHHQASFRRYILDAFGKFVGKETVTDDEFLSTTTPVWRAFEKTKPWKPLMGIAHNAFAFIFRDIMEAKFAPDLYKWDSSNDKFLRVTGIADLIANIDQQSVISFMQDLATNYTLREINKGIYTYCSDTESKQFGFCRSLADCERCEVIAICEKRFA